LSDTQHSEKVRVEQLTRFLDARFFQSARDRIAGVVDQDVDLASVFQYRLRPVLYAFVVGYIHEN
jgi:hypothetical protein